MPPRDQSDAFAFDTGRYRLEASAPREPTSDGGYGLISSVSAYRSLHAAVKPAASGGPLVAIRAIRLGHDTFVPDRGKMRLSAWPVYAKGLRQPAAVLAVQPCPIQP